MLDAKGSTKKKSPDDPLAESNNDNIPKTVVHNKIHIDIKKWKTLHINANLNDLQRKRQTKKFQKYKQDFAWDYWDMRGIDPQLFTHHIYIEKYPWEIIQPQRRLNPHLSDIMK